MTAQDRVVTLRVDNGLQLRKRCATFLLFAQGSPVAKQISDAPLEGSGQGVTVTRGPVGLTLQDGRELNVR